MTVTASKILCLVSVVIFALATFGVTVGDSSDHEMLAAGLAFGFASFLVP